MKRFNNNNRGDVGGEALALLIPACIIVPLAIVVVIYYVGCGIVYSYKYVFDRKTLDTEQTVELAAENFKRDGVFPPTKDAWGQGITISVRTDNIRGGAAFKEYAKFSSMGKDGKFTTKDDIVSEETFYIRENPDYKKPLSEKAGEVTTKATKSFFRGIFNVVRESK